MNLPRILHFQVTERCNLACPGCYLPERTGKGVTAATAASRVFEPLAAMGVTLTTLTGGEPLLNPEFTAICAEARRFFDEVQVVTNGLLLDLETFFKLREAGVSSIKVSLDGATPVTHDALRGMDGAFERTVGNLKAITALHRAERSGVELGAIATAQAANAGELEAIATLCAEIGLDHLLVQPYHPYGFVYPRSGIAPARPELPAETLDTLLGDIGMIRRIKDKYPDFIDNKFEMLEAFSEFFTRPGGPRQLCGADSFVFVNSRLEVRGCLFCEPLASLSGFTPEEVFASGAWKGFQDFRRSCRLCLMGCQFRGKAQRLADRGFAVWNQERWQDALRLFEAALKREYSVDADHGLGLSLKQLGRLDEAEACFRRVLEARQDHPSAPVDLGECLRLRGRHAEALAILEPLVLAGRGTAPAHYNYGAALLALGRPAQALDQIMHGAGGEPGNAWMRFDVGMCLKALGRLEEAVVHYEAAAELDKSIPWFPYRQGLTLVELDRPEEGLAKLRQAVEIAPGEARPNMELGRLLKSMGDPEADRYLRKAGRIDPALVEKEFPQGF